MGYGQSAIDKNDTEIFRLFKANLEMSDLTEAKTEVGEALAALTKASLAELKAIVKPNAMVEKTLLIVVALKGYKNINFNTAKEMLGKQSFKVDLCQMTPATMRSADVLQAQRILTEKTNTMLTPENVQMSSEAAALLLIWAANMIKYYACWKKIGPPAEKVAKPLREEDLKKISNRTKVMLKNKAQDEGLETKEFKKKAIQFKKEGITAVNPQKGKTQNIGHFLNSKKMDFS